MGQHAKTKIFRFLDVRIGMLNGLEAFKIHSKVTLHHGQPRSVR